MFDESISYTYYKCTVIPRQTKIPGTDQTFQEGAKDVKCQNEYNNLSQGAGVNYCDMHYTEYQDKAF